MVDLLADLDAWLATLDEKHAGEIPISPISPDENSAGEMQVIDIPSISPISPISPDLERGGEPARGSSNENHLFARGGVRRSRVVSFFQGEIGEIGEIVDISKACISPGQFSGGEIGEIVPPAANWGNSLASLAPWKDPCPGFATGAWRNVRAKGLAFLAAFRDIAVACKWSSTELFGVHPVVGVARVDCCGVLMLNTADEVLEVSQDVIRHRNGLVSRRGALPLESVPVWVFGMNRRS